MKKVFSILLALLLLVSLGTAAMADDSTFTSEEMGITLQYPEEFGNLQGLLFLSPQGIIAYEPDVYYMPIFYFAMPKADAENLLHTDLDDITEEDIATIQAAQGQVGMVLACEGGLENVLAVLGVDEMPEDIKVEEFGMVDGLHYFFLFSEDEEYLSGIEETYAEELRMLQKKFPEILKSAELYTPVDPTDKLVGMTVSFETVDLNGNTVSSKDLFAENEVTMVNYWGTWCGACVGELGELAEIHTRLQEKGCGIVGIVEDGEDAEKVELAKQILAENGVEYPNVVYHADMGFLDEVSSFPTSFFVDKDGKILCHPISGAAVDLYESTIEKLLTGETVSGLTMPAASENDAGAYRVTVTDQEGNPVQGVAIQFCDDSSCSLGKTDENGVASFEQPEGVNYVVHVLKVPEGFEKTNDEFHTLDVYSDIIIVLNKAA